MATPNLQSKENASMKPSYKRYSIRGPNYYFEKGEEIVDQNILSLRMSYNHQKKQDDVNMMLGFVIV